MKHSTYRRFVVGAALAVPLLFSACASAQEALGAKERLLRIDVMETTPPAGHPSFAPQYIHVNPAQIVAVWDPSGADAGKGWSYMKLADGHLLKVRMNVAQIKEALSKLDW